MWYSGTGDEGYTSLFGGERIEKTSPRLEALGDLDEAQAAIGVARAHVLRQETKPLLAQVQRTLYLLMAEVATPEPARLRQRVESATVTALEQNIARLADSVPREPTFIIPGDTPGGAALDLARTVVRRAERRVVGLLHAGQLENAHLVRYLNRLSSLLFLLARIDDAAGGAAEQE